MRRMPSPPRVSIVIAVYNERATIEELLERVQAVALDKELVVIDEVLAGLHSPDVRVVLRGDWRIRGVWSTLRYGLGG
jgi:cellulose synthase/poly-beta-1,6-N-acetylglucosamine synthase-like glycosyltransferase